MLFFNDTATTEIYTLSLHDALPIYVYPGRYPRQMIREILLYHTRTLVDPAQRIAAARRLLEQLDHPEARSLMEQGDDSLFHDDLAPVNDPVWFHEFAAHAQRHGLQY